MKASNFLEGLTMKPPGKYGVSSLEAMRLGLNYFIVETTDGKQQAVIGFSDDPNAEAYWWKDKTVIEVVRVISAIRFPLY